MAILYDKEGEMVCEKVDEVSGSDESEDVGFDLRVELVNRWNLLLSTSQKSQEISILYNHVQEHETIDRDEEEEIRSLRAYIRADQARHDCERKRNRVRTDWSGEVTEG